MTSNDQPDQPKPGGERKSRWSDWYFPPDLALLLAPFILLILSWPFLRLAWELKRAEVLHLYYTALGCGVVGIVLLFFARLPLYRRRRFWTVGPRELDRFHRKLYKLAYVFVVLSILLLLVVWARVR